MIDWVIMIFSLIGLSLIIRKERPGYLIWAFVDAAWFYFVLSKAIYGMALLYFIFVLFDMQGFMIWRKDNETIRTRK